MAKPSAQHELPPFDFDTWEGVRRPDYTQFPDELLDDIMPYLSGAEWKVLSYIVRKTFGWKKQYDYISTSQLERGIRNRETGEVVDRGTGLSRPTICKAIQLLEAKRLIIVIRQQAPDGDAEVNCYRLRMASEGPRGVVKKSDYPRRGVVKEVNHGYVNGLTTGSKKSYPTRKPSTTEDPTLPQTLNDIAVEFLRAIGYPRPSAAKRERTIRILTDLLVHDHYTVDDLRTACEIAASLGARGPELIPHVIGQASEPSSTTDEVGERLAQAQGEARERWRELAERFDGLSKAEQRRLSTKARSTSPILAKRPDDHPLVRAAAIALLDNE